MPKFPSKETDIIALAQTIAAGIAAHPTVFPSPPVVAADLTQQVTNVLQARDAATALEASLRQKVAEKNSELSAAVEMMKSNITYAEMLAKGDEAILAMIGWSGRAAPTALQPPGQCRALEIIGQGDGWVRLDWKEPSDGGKVAAYKVQRSEDGANFQDTATAVESEAAMFNQPTGKTLIYRAVAINKAGEGLPSNTVSITL